MVEAEAEKEAIKRIIEALSSKGQADKYLIAMKYLETMKEMTSGQDNKIVYMPYEASAVLSSVDGIREMLSAKREPEMENPAPRRVPVFLLPMLLSQTAPSYFPAAGCL